MTSGRVAFVAAPYGFGPSSKAIAIASHLPATIERVFFGAGPSLDLARASGAFSDCAAVDFGSSAAIAASGWARFGTLVFVNSARFITEASRLVPFVLYVDTLAWARPVLPFDPQTLDRYFAQRFFEHVLAPQVRTASCFRDTGAIVPKTALRNESCAIARTPIVHCGGLCSPTMRPGADIAFVSLLRTALLETDFPARVILPRHLHHVFASQSTGAPSLIDCSPLDVGTHIGGSRCALTTSGIEFTYESMLAGVPTVFLPPFNATQLLQLDYHRATFAGAVNFPGSRPTAGLASHSFDAATAAIQEDGMRGAWAEQFHALRPHLKQLASSAGDNQLHELRRQQAFAVARVGADGGQTIAAHIIDRCGTDVQRGDVQWTSRNT